MKKILFLLMVISLIACDQAPEFGRIESNAKDHTETVVVQTNKEQIELAQRLVRNFALEARDRESSLIKQTYKIMLKSNVELKDRESIKKAININKGDIKALLDQEQKNKTDKYEALISSLNNKLEKKVSQKKVLLERGDHFLSRKEELKKLYSEASQNKENAKKKISDIGSKLHKPEQVFFNAIKQPLNDNFYATRFKNGTCHKSWWEEENKYKAGAASFSLGEFTLDGTTVCGYYIIKKMTYKFQREKEVIADVRNKFTKKQLNNVLRYAKVAAKNEWLEHVYEDYFNNPSNDPHNKETSDVGKPWRNGEPYEVRELKIEISKNEKELKNAKEYKVTDSDVIGRYLTYHEKIMKNEPVIQAIYAGVGEGALVPDAGGRFRISSKNSTHLAIFQDLNSKSDASLAIIDLDIFSKRDEIIILGSDFVNIKDQISKVRAEANVKREHEFKNMQEKLLKSNMNKKGVIVTESGLQYEVLKAGKGKKPVAEDTVKVNYVGRLADGLEFDNSYKKGNVAIIPLDRVIAGFSEGIQLMSVGSKYRFIVPQHLAYGDRDIGSIPANSVLDFEVELIDIENRL